MRGEPVPREDRKRKRNDAKRRISHNDWSDDIEDEEDAKIRETWAFQRLETYHKEVLPNGFPPEIDLNAVFHERSEEHTSESSHWE